MKLTTLSRAIAALCVGAILFAADAPAQTFDSGSSNTSSYSGATVGTSASTIVAAGAALKYLDITNVDPALTVCIKVKGTATISGTACAAGEIYLAPNGGNKTWEGSFIPPDAVSAIASGAGALLTIGVK